MIDGVGLKIKHQHFLPILKQLQVSTAKIRVQISYLAAKISFPENR
jgi:hypothetical protein